MLKWWSVAVLNFAIFLTFWTTSNKVLGLEQAYCNSSLGLQNGRIKDSHFSASSFIHSLEIEENDYQDMKPEHARLNSKLAWCSNDHKSWLIVNLGKVAMVNAIATQGYATYYNHYYVKDYCVQYSIDGKTWNYIQENNSKKVFVGNKQGRDTVSHKFNTTEAQYIKIIPLDYKYKTCMRLELYGCFKDTFTSPPTSLQNTTKPVVLPSVTTSMPKPSSISHITIVNSVIPSKNQSKNKTQSAASRSSSSSKRNVVILGCSAFVGFIVFVSLIVFATLWLRKQRQKRKITQDESNCKLTDAQVYVHIEDDQLSLEYGPIKL